MGRPRKHQNLITDEDIYYLSRYRLINKYYYGSDHRVNLEDVDEENIDRPETETPYVMEGYADELLPLTWWDVLDRWPKRWHVNVRLNENLLLDPDVLEITHDRLQHVPPENLMHEILRLRSTGMTETEIAMRTGMSQGNVVFYLKKISKQGSVEIPVLTGETWAVITSYLGPDNGIWIRTYAETRNHTAAAERVGWWQSDIALKFQKLVMMVTTGWKLRRPHGWTAEMIHALEHLRETLPAVYDQLVTVILGLDSWRQAGRANQRWSKFNPRPAAPEARDLVYGTIRPQISQNHPK
jgi:hypothetical protein